MKRYKRKNFIINRRIQYGMIAAFLFAVLIAFILSTAGLVLYYSLTFSGGDHAPATGVALTPARIILIPILINNLCIMIVITVFGIFFSHRIAGPLFQMQCVLDEVLSGESGKRVRLRKNDFSNELALNINRIIGELDRLRNK